MPRAPNESYSKWLRFKLRWEKQYPGEEYIKTDKDFRFCKTVLVGVSDAVMDARMEVFFDDDWWGEHGQHPLVGFANNINSFAPKKKEVPKVFQYACPLCHAEHPPNEPCKSKNPAAPLVDILAKQMAMPKDTTPDEIHNQKFGYTKIAK